MKAISPEFYQKFINHLAIARNTILKIHNAMYNSMKQAKKNKRILDNPCIGVVIPGNKQQEDEALKFIDSDDVPALLNQAYQYGYMYWIFFKVLIETGMRKGEVAALQWGDIDFKEKTRRISKSLDFQPDEADEIFGDTKNRKTRVIDMADITVSA